jgi:hypothetical protein
MGGGVPLAREIYDSLNTALGTGYDTSVESTVTAETSAEARLIAACWHANERATNQFDPWRMVDFLSRWETILGIPPRRYDTNLIRRSRVAAKFAAICDPTNQSLYTLCSNALGSAFVDIEYTDIVGSTMMWPGNGFPLEWYSTTAHIVVRVIHPPTMTDIQFESSVGYLMQMLYDFLPDWATVDWAMVSSSGTEGFILDDDHNLDTETFD